jgi:hypothetical protein
MRSWNCDAAHAKPGMCAIDLICGPIHRPLRGAVELIDSSDGGRLSDHVGYVVEL